MGSTTAAATTKLRCQAPHPVRGVDRRHRAHLATAGGVWEHTDAVVQGELARAVEPREDGRLWAYCVKCKAASEYRRVDHGTT